MVEGTIEDIINSQFRNFFAHNLSERYEIPGNMEMLKEKNMDTKEMWLTCDADGTLKLWDDECDSSTDDERENSWESCAGRPKDDNTKGVFKFHRLVNPSTPDIKTAPWKIKVTARECRPGDSDKELTAKIHEMKGKVELMKDAQKCGNYELVKGCRDELIRIAQTMDLGEEIEGK